MDARKALGWEKAAVAVALATGAVVGAAAYYYQYRRCVVVLKTLTQAAEKKPAAAVQPTVTHGHQAAGFASLAPTSCGRPQPQYAQSQTANIAPVPKHRLAEQVVDGERSSASVPQSASASSLSTSSSTSDGAGATSYASSSSTSASTASAPASVLPSAPPHPYLFHYSDLCRQSCAPQPQPQQGAPQGAPQRPEVQLRSPALGQPRTQQQAQQQQGHGRQCEGGSASSVPAPPSSTSSTQPSEQRDSDPPAEAVARGQGQGQGQVQGQGQGQVQQGSAITPPPQPTSPGAQSPPAPLPVPAPDPQLPQPAVLPSPFAHPQQLLLQLHPALRPQQLLADPGYGRAQVAAAQTASTAPVARPKPPPLSEAPTRPGEGEGEAERDVSPFGSAYAARRQTRRHAASRRYDYDYGSRRQSRRTPDSEGEGADESPFHHHHHPHHYGREPPLGSRPQSPLHSPLPRSRLIAQQAPLEQRPPGPGSARRLDGGGSGSGSQQGGPQSPPPPPPPRQQQQQLEAASAPGAEVWPGVATLKPAPTAAPTLTPVLAPPSTREAGVASADLAFLSSPRVTIHTNSLYGSPDESDTDADPPITAATTANGANGTDNANADSETEAEDGTPDDVPSTYGAPPRSARPVQPVVVVSPPMGASPSGSRDSSRGSGPPAPAPARPVGERAPVGGRQRPRQPGRQVALLLGVPPGFDVRRNQAYDGGGTGGSPDARPPRSSRGVGGGADMRADETPGPAPPLFGAGPQLFTFAAFAAGAAASVSAAAAAAAAAATTAAAAASTAAAAAATASAAATAAAASSAAAAPPAPAPPPSITVVVHPVLGLPAGTAGRAGTATTSTEPIGSPGDILPNGPVSGADQAGQAEARHWSAAQPAQPLAHRCRVARGASADGLARLHRSLSLSHAGDDAAGGAGPVPCSQPLRGRAGGSSAGSGASQPQPDHRRDALLLRGRAALSAAEAGAAPKRRRRAASSDGSRPDSSASGSRASSASGSVGSVSSLTSLGSTRSRRCSCPICQSRARRLLGACSGSEGGSGGGQTGKPRASLSPPARGIRNSHSVSAGLSVAARLAGATGASGPGARSPSRLARAETLGRGPWQTEDGCSGHSSWAGCGAGDAVGSTCSAAVSGGDATEPLVPATPPQGPSREAPAPHSDGSSAGTAGGGGLISAGASCERSLGFPSQCASLARSAPTSPTASAAAQAPAPWHLMLPPASEPAAASGPAALYEAPSSPVGAAAPAAAGLPGAWPYVDVSAATAAGASLPWSFAGEPPELLSAPSFSPMRPLPGDGPEQQQQQQQQEQQQQQQAQVHEQLELELEHGQTQHSPRAEPAGCGPLAPPEPAPCSPRQAGSTSTALLRSPVLLPRVATLQRTGSGGGAAVRRSAPQLRPWLYGNSSSFRAGSAAAPGSASGSRGSLLSAQSSASSLRRSSAAGAEGAEGGGGASFMRHTAASIAKIRSPRQREAALTGAAQAPRQAPR